MGLSRRIENALAAAREAADNVSHDGNSPLRPGPVSGVAYLAFEPHWTVDALATRLSREKAPWRATASILITDANDVEFYQLGGFISEHLPKSDENDAQLIYAGRKLSSILRKWNVFRLTPLDGTAAKFIETLVDRALVDLGEIKVG